jgi:hypothetical protein
VDALSLVQDDLVTHGDLYSPFLKQPVLDNISYVALPQFGSVLREALETALLWNMRLARPGSYETLHKAALVKG